jgi:hypothetical protein
MTTSTDGKTIVYIVFNADGYECKDFVGAFESEAAALAAAQRIEGLIRRFYAERMEGRLEWAGAVTVEPVVLGDYDLPGVAFAMEDVAG